MSNARSTDSGPLVTAQLRRAAGFLLVAVLVAVVAPASQAQDAPDVDALVLAFDDPTLLARAIDERIATDVASCMEDSGFDYVVAADARFDLEPVEIQEEVAPELDLSVRELVPRVIDPTAIDSSMIDPGLEVEVPNAPRINPGAVDPTFATARRVEDLPSLVGPGLTDPALRLRPRDEGYGISLDAFDVDNQDPNVAVVAGLNPEERRDYETALYGRPVSEFTEETKVGGCAADIQAILENEIYPILVQLDMDLTALETAIESDPEYEEAVEQWAECIENTDVAREFGLRTPEEAIALANSRLDAVGSDDPAAIAAARDFEKDLAEADYGCRAVTTDPAMAAVLLTDGGRFAGSTLEVVAEFGS